MAATSEKNKKEWSRVETNELIEVYEENSILWNHKTKNHRNRVVKDKTYKEISQKFNCTADEVQRKLHNLRNQVSQELKKCRTKKSGNGTNDDYVSNWPYFKALKFLIPILTVRESKGSQPTISGGSTRFKAKSQLQYTQKKDNLPDVDNNKQFTKRQKNKDDDNVRVSQDPMKVLMNEPDEYDNFGQYVAMELKGLQSVLNRKRLKTEIRKAIVRIVEEDDNVYNYEPSSTLCVCTSASSSIGVSPASQESSVKREDVSMTTSASNCILLDCSNL